MHIFLLAVCACALPLAVEAAEPVRITKIEPTIFFPAVKAGEPLRQTVRLGVESDGATREATVRIHLPPAPAYDEPIGMLAAGATVHAIHVPDVARPAELTVELYEKDDPKPVAVQKTAWQPQRKWKVYCVSYSHHDLGYGDYPHRLRTTIRHANIERLLRFCRETDSWDEDCRFRFMIETSEPITSFLAGHSEAEAAELARRVRQGRIQIGALHNTANTEQLSHECLARLFYLTNRHTRDLLGTPASRTAQIDDVIGLSWPLATLCGEADVPYLFHGPNKCAHCFQPASNDPVFFWQGPDGRGRVLVRSVPYAGCGGDPVGSLSDAHVESVIGKFAGPRWPYDAMLLQDETDFSLVTRDTADKVRAFRARWAYPRMICATMDMFFDAVAAEAGRADINTFAKDGNNQWAEQDATDAWLLGLARRQGEAVPTAEKFAAIAQCLAGGGYPWTDVYQAYHRLLTYHEHTNAIDHLAPERERMRRYETELEEDREMVTESKQFSGRVLDGSLSRLTGLITTGAERNLVVFNPLARLRTDVVRVAAGRLPERFVLTDAAAGADVACQRLPDGEVIFLATDVPPTGYKTYSVSPETAEPAAASPPSSAAQRPVVLENSFYRVEFDEAAGAITGLRDKQLGVELVDRTAPHKFNEYLYERFETPDVNQPSTWHRVQSAEVRAVRGPVADVVTVTAAPAGVESMRQTITLYHGLNRIDFRLEIVKSPSGRTAAVPRTSVLNRESLYLALPFAVPEGRFHHELAGGVVEPIRDQFVGSCTAHYAVRHFADVSNRRYGVTLATVEAPLVEYGRPRSRPVTGRGALGEDAFEKVVQYPANSRMYLYLLNNMFDTNIRWDQAGPMSFSYFLRSHQGDWRSGKADEFGWAVHCPLLAVPVRGKRRGLLPASAGLLAVDPPHVVCTVVKPAEWNGSGLILRLVETRGLPANATVFLPFFGPIASATETDLVENDRPAPLELKGPAQFALGMRPFGVKTVRVLSSRPRPAAVQHLVASPVSDMEVALSWQADAAAEKDTSHYHVYRGTTAGFRPTLLNLVERPTAASCTDRPQLNYGGWINNRLEPETTYYYRVAAVDRWNSEGPLSAAVAATTLKSSQGRRTPLRVECLRAVCVSPLAPFRFVNLLFRTNCEPDVVRYEIFRSTQPGFAQDDSKLIGTVEADAVIKGSTEYGHTPVDHRVREFDHAMYEDDSALPETTYYYCVRAVDRAGRKGPASLEAQVRIGR